MLTKEQRDEILRLAAELIKAPSDTWGSFERLVEFTKYIDSITVPEWNPTDEELTTIYKTANNEVGKGKPITTQRIFTAMRAMLTSAPKRNEAADRIESTAQRVPLTVDRIEELANQHNANLWRYHAYEQDAIIRLIRAVECEHGIGGEK